MWMKLPQKLNPGVWWGPDGTSTSGSAAASLQDCLFNNPSFLINCKIIILRIIQSCFYTLVQVLQGDEVLWLFLLQNKITSGKDDISSFSSLEDIFYLTCSCKISISFALMNSCCCCSRLMAASACLRSISSFSFWIRWILKCLGARFTNPWSEHPSLITC